MVRERLIVNNRPNKLISVRRLGSPSVCKQECFIGEDGSELGNCNSALNDPLFPTLFSPQLGNRWSFSTSYFFLYQSFFCMCRATDLSTMVYWLLMALFGLETPSVSHGNIRPICLESYSSSYEWSTDSANFFHQPQVDTCTYTIADTEQSMHEEEAEFKTRRQLSENTMIRHRRADTLQMSWLLHFCCASNLFSLTCVTTWDVWAYDSLILYGPGNRAELRARFLRVSLIRRFLHPMRRDGGGGRAHEMIYKVAVRGV